MGTIWEDISNETVRFAFKWSKLTRTTEHSLALWCLLLQTEGWGMYDLAFSFFLFFFPSKEMKSPPWQERVKSLSRPPQRLESRLSPTSQCAIVLRQALPCCSVFLATGQPPRLWSEERAVLWPGPCYPGPGFTPPECLEGCPVSRNIFHSPVSISRGF